MDIRQACSDKYFVFDVDNTLLFTDAANNEAYNKALREFGFDEILSSERITRETVWQTYPDMDKTTLARLIERKQELFAEESDRIIPNSSLISILKSISGNRYMLWTGGSEVRTVPMLLHWMPFVPMNKILFSDKLSIEEDIERICSLLSCRKSDLIIFDDSPIIIQKLAEMQIEAYYPDEKTREE